MIKSISIRNFQSHKLTEISFSNGVNGIIGISQSGKTAILRAFTLLASNRPQGARFFNKQASTKELCAVQVVLSTGEIINVFKEVSKSKDGKLNLKDTYYEMDGESWKGSREVPDKIKEKLNLGELNIQNQLDPPFLVTSSSGEIAKVINRVTHLEQVDEFVSELNQKISAFTREVKVREQGIETANDMLDNLPDIEKAENLLKRLKVIENKNNKLIDEREDIIYILQELDTCIEEIEFYEKEVEKGKKTEKIFSQFVRIQNAQESLSKEAGLLNEYIILTEETKRIAISLKEDKKELGKILAEQKICPTCGAALNIVKILQENS